MLLKLYYGYAGIAFSVFAEAIRGDVLLATQILMDCFAQCAGSFAVDDPHRGEVGKISVIQIFIEFYDCFIGRHAEQVQLRADRRGLGHPNLATAGGLCTAAFAVSRKLILKLFQILQIDL